MIEDKEIKQLGIKSVINVFGDELSQDTINILYTLSNQQRSISYKRLDFKRDKNLPFGLRDYKSLKELLRVIYYKTFAIEEAERMQDEFKSVLNVSEEYSLRKPE